MMKTTLRPLHSKNLKSRFLDEIRFQGFASGPLGTELAERLRLIRTFDAVGFLECGGTARSIAARGDAALALRGAEGGQGFEAIDWPFRAAFPLGPAPPKAKAASPRAAMPHSKKARPCSAAGRYHGLFAKAALSLLIVAWLAVRPCPGQNLTAAQAEEWRTQIREALFIPEPLPELASEIHGRFEPEPGVIAERITYGTQFGLRVPAILYLPARHSGNLPGLVIVNGHGGDKYSWYSFYSGVVYARAGAAVLTFDPIGEGERNLERESGTRAHDKVVPPREMGQRMGGLLVTDVMQAVSYLAGRPEVSPERLAAMGYSLGSFLVSLAGAADTRPHACVMVGGGNLDGPGGYWDGSKPMCQGIPYQSLMFLGDRPAALYALHALRGPTLVYNGLEDTVVAIPRHGKPFFKELQERTVRLKGDADVFETGFVPDASHRPFFVTKPVAVWLERHLDFPNWTEDDILSMSESHISAWADTNRVEMDPRYSNEQREGGTRALGTGVPGLTRDQLSVFGLEEWEREKARMIYESWVRRAGEQLAGGRD